MLGFARVGRFMARTLTFPVRFVKKLLGVAVLALFQLPVYAHTGFSSYWNMPKGVTSVSHAIYHMHMIALWVGVGISVFVFGWMLFILISYRRSKGAVPGSVHEHIGVEIIWTIIPFILLIIMAVPATRILLKIHDETKPSMTIKVTGYQWKWSYEYLDQGIRFYSQIATPQAEINNQRAASPNFLLEVDHPLVLPVGQKVRLLITSNDVIHDWWVPDLGVKQDAIPGYVNETWTKIDKVGTYRGECAELCGTYHGFMPIVVKAVSPAEFQQWLAKQKVVGGGKVGKSSKPSAPLSKNALLALGEKIYEKDCAVCHQSNGKGLPPTFPAIKGSPIATGPVGPHLEIVINGKKGTAMQAFSEQLQPQELAAVVTYQRHAWGNEAINKAKGHDVVVHASDVTAAEG